MKFSILGSAHNHVFGFAENMLLAGCELAGIYDDGTENAHKLSEKYGSPLGKSPESLLENGVEIAGSFSPSDERIDAVRLCAAKGVHIMCDKPLIVDQAGLRELEGVLDSGKIQVGAMFTVRFMASVCALKKVLDSGEIGEIVSIEIFNPHKLTPENRPEWHFSRAKSGGVAVDLLTHSIDLFHWLTGRGTFAARSCTVLKSILPQYPEFEDFASAAVYTPDGINGYFRVDWHMSESHWNWGDLRVFVVGTAGCAEARVTGDPITRREELIVYSPNAQTRSVPLTAASENEVTDFLKRIQGQEHCVRSEDIRFVCRETLELDRCAVRLSRA